MTPTSTPSGKWVLYDRATGSRLERWPVDARDMLARGECVASPPEQSDEVVSTVDVGTTAPVAPSRGRRGR